MKTLIATLLLTAGLVGTAAAQQVQPQRLNQALTNARVMQSIETIECQVAAIHIAQSGILFMCRGGPSPLAMPYTFDGGDLPGGVAAAVAILERHRNEPNAMLRVRMRPVENSAICNELGITRQCYEAIGFGG